MVALMPAIEILVFHNVDWQMRSAMSEFSDSNYPDITGAVIIGVTLGLLGPLVVYLLGY